MFYKLKSGIETFEIVSGPDAGKSYVRAKVYDRVPEGYEHKFEPVGLTSAPADASTASTEPTPPPGCAAARAKARSRTSKAVEKIEPESSEPIEKGE
jgi:hypothetical protein